MEKRSKRVRMLVIFLCHLLAFQNAFSQQASVQRSLSIVVIEGTGARNVVRQIPARPLTVRVQDAGKPLQGATVTFMSPQTGPSGEFANDSRTFRVITDENGIASAAGFHPNGSEGPYLIQVRAEFQGATANESIAQVNVGQKKGRKKLFAVLGLVVAAGAAIAFRSGGSTPPSTPTITFGGGVVGAPQ